MTELYDEEQDDSCLTEKDFIDLAKTYLTMFFKNRLDDNGCEIEIEELHTKRNISLVLNLSICDGMPLIYEALDSKKAGPKRKGKISEDVEFVIKMLNECAKLSMPKPFAAGLIAVYLETCKGCKIEV